MSIINLTPVKTPTGSEYSATWDSSTKQVKVGNEDAGTASSEAEAQIKANYYATTLQKMK